MWGRGGGLVAVEILEGVGFISDEILCIYNETSKGSNIFAEHHIQFVMSDEVLL